MQGLWKTCLRTGTQTPCYIALANLSQGDLGKRGRFHSLMGKGDNSPSMNVVCRKRLYSAAFEMCRSLAFSGFAELYTRTLKVLM